MELITQNYEVMFTFIISLLTVAQLAVNYFLPPEKAEKFNFIGKILAFAVNTKAGVSPKQEK